MKKQNADLEKQFDEFWSVKPRRDGDNPKSRAFKSFCAAVRDGADPLMIIGAARLWAQNIEKNKKTGTEFVPMAMTWLNQRRFDGYVLPTKEECDRFDAIGEKHGMHWNGERWEKKNAAASA